MKLSEILRASSDHALAQRATALELALSLAVKTIERHVGDWRTDLRMGVTVILPALRSALARSEETDPCHYCDSEDHEHGWCLEQGR